MTLTTDDMALLEWAVTQLESGGTLSAPPPDPRRQSPIPQQGLVRMRELVRRLRLEDASTYAASLPSVARVSA